MVGTMQLCTVTFLLVGWVWSLVWGIYMIILAGKKRKHYVFTAFNVSKHFVGNLRSGHI